MPARLARRLLAEQASGPRLETERFEGAILFADISGFTRLTERLAAAGPEGAETPTEVLNAYFETLLAVITQHGGEVLKFAGDAAIAVWDGSAEESVRRAARCGWDIQQAMASREPVAGETLQLRVGVSCGELRTAHVGGVKGRWEYLLVGEPVARMGPAAAAARPGEVSLSAAASERLGRAGEPLADGHVKVARLPLDSGTYQERYLERSAELTWTPDREMLSREKDP